MKGCRAWDPLVALQCLFTDGTPRLSSDESALFTLCEGGVKQLSLLTAESLHDFKQEEEEIIAFAVTPSDKVVTASRNNLFRYWVEPAQCWRSDCAVLCMEVDPKGSLLATGGGDNSIRIYQLGHQYLTHCFKDHKAPILSLVFHPSDYKVASCSYDYTVKVFDLLKYKCVASVHTGEHPVRMLGSGAGIGLVGATGGLEIVRWNFDTLQETSRTMVKQEITALSVSPTAVFIGDESGQITEFHPHKSSLKKHRQETLSLSPVQTVIPLQQSAQIVATTAEQTIFLLSNRDFSVQREILGHVDEILDLRFIPGQRSLYVANNSPGLKLITFHEVGYTVQELKGHSDAVLCLDLAGDMVVTGAKDNTVRLWRGGKCVCVFEGHTHSVSSVAFFKKSHIVSASLDQSIKVWKVTDSPTAITAAEHTCIAHLKSVNVVKVSPDNKLIFSGGHDKAVKVWDKRLKEVRVLDGHKRGVWDLAVNGADRVLASASGDGTVRLWSLADYVCLRTFEGHSSSVIRVKFLPGGGHVVTSSADALVKVFNARSGVCTATLEKHEDKVWGLDSTEINGTAYFATGAADSRLILWKDVTLEEELKVTEEQRQQIAQEQEMQTKLKSGHKQEAAVLALTLNRPMALFTIVSELDQTETVYFVDQVIESSEESVSALLRILVDWNTQKKFCSQAHKVLIELLERIPFSKFPETEKAQLQVFHAYSEKHFLRVSKLMQNTYKIDHFLEEQGVRTEKRGRKKGGADPGARKVRKTE